MKKLYKNGRILIPIPAIFLQVNSSVFLNYLSAHHKRAFDTSCITSTSTHDHDIINILDTKLFYPVFHPFPLVFPYKTHSNHSFHQKRPFPFSRKGLFIDFVTISHRFTIGINRITTYDLSFIYTNSFDIRIAIFMTSDNIHTDTSQFRCKFSDSTFV